MIGPREGRDYDTQIGSINVLVWLEQHWYMKKGSKEWGWKVGASSWFIKRRVQHPELHKQCLTNSYKPHSIFVHI